MLKGGARMRFSKQKQLIENIVKGRFDHPTADNIYMSCREYMPSISLGTVYRNLKVLSEEGAIETLESVDKKIHYDGRDGFHSHFICVKCGNIHDVMESQSFPKELESEGYSVLASKNTYYGVCPLCKEKIN